MKIAPKISIITAVLNSRQYLESTILSVLGQNYANLEYIIIDGGSTDGTIDIINKYENKLTFWISEPDNGMYHAIQKGFEKAGGEIFAWLNSGDLYHPEALNKVADIFSELNHVDWIVGMPNLFNEEGQCVQVFPIVKWSQKKILAGDYRWIQQESVFFRSSVWNRNSGKLDTSFKYAADFELWLRFFQNTKLYSVNNNLGGFRKHENQLSVLHALQYEAEAKKIIIQYRRFSSKKLFISLIAMVCFLKNNALLSRHGIIRWTGKIIAGPLNKLYALPKPISYDFKTSQWIQKN